MRCCSSARLMLKPHCRGDSPSLGRAGGDSDGVSGHLLEHTTERLHRLCGSVPPVRRLSSGHGRISSAMTAEKRSAVRTAILMTLGMLWEQQGHLASSPGIEGLFRRSAPISRMRVSTCAPDWGRAACMRGHKKKFTLVDPLTFHSCRLARYQDRMDASSAVVAEPPVHASRM